MRPGTLVEPLDERRIRCVACGHACPLPDGAAGVCKVRFNRGGTLYVPWGYVGGVQCDPVEKKPFFHVLPGSLAYSFGMLGCDLHCGYCQNWVTSQALRDPSAVVPPRYTDPETLVREAVRAGARLLVSTYNEPLITAEWAVEIFTHARRAGLLTAFVSNGNATPQVLDYLQPHIDCYKVDLKSFDDKHYRQLGGRLAPILETIASLHARGIWVEVVTLLVPGFNDSLRRDRRADAVSCGRLARHPVARHRVSRRLPDDRPPRHDRASTDRGRRDRQAERPAIRVCGQSSRPRGRPREHALRRVRRDAGRAAWICGRREPHDDGRWLPGVSRQRCQESGLRACRLAPSPSLRSAEPS